MGRGLASPINAGRVALIVVAICVHACPAHGTDNVVVVLDDSSSMRNWLRSNRRVVKMDAAKDALIKVLKKLPKQTRVGVLTLHNEGKWTVPLGPVDPSAMESAIRAINPNSGTPLGRYMKIASDSLLQLREQQRYGTYRLLIVTDGEANDRGKVERYLPDILSRGITVDVIGVDMQADHSLATKAHSYRRANDAASLSEALSEVLAESIVSDQTGADEYQLLEGIPNPLGLAMVDALAQARNHPIGEIEPVAFTGSEENIVARQPIPTNVATPADTGIAGSSHIVESEAHGKVIPAQKPQRVRWSFILLAAMAVGVVFFVVILALMVKLSSG